MATSKVPQNNLPLQIPGPYCMIWVETAWPVNEIMKTKIMER